MTPREIIEKSIHIAPDILKIDIVLGEQMLTEAEKLLPKVLETDPAWYPFAVSKLQEIWSDYVMGVMLFEEDEVPKEPTCH